MTHPYCAFGCLYKPFTVSVVRIFALIISRRCDGSCRCRQHNGFFVSTRTACIQNSRSYDEINLMFQPNLVHIVHFTNEPASGIIKLNRYTLLTNRYFCFTYELNVTLCVLAKLKQCKCFVNSRPNPTGLLACVQLYIVRRETSLVDSFLKAKLC